MADCQPTIRRLLANQTGLLVETRYLIAGIMKQHIIIVTVASIVFYVSEFWNLSVLSLVKGHIDFIAGFIPVDTIAHDR